MFEIIAVICFVSVALLLSSVKVVPDYERLVVFRFGHLLGPRGPGLQVILPFVEHYTKIDLRVSTIPIELHEVITRDDVTLKIDAVCLFQIINPKLLVGNVKEAQPVAEELVRSGLTGTLRQNSFADIERAQEIILKRLRSAIDRQTASLGIKVNSIQIKSMEVLRVSNGRKVTQGESLSDLRIAEQIAERILDGELSNMDMTDFERSNDWKPDGDNYQYGHSSYSFGNGHYEFGHDESGKRDSGET
jgi:regulator of protease activity HflC (stomatin/prohibitin superfamily)